jgi:hypothetical protein
MGGIEIGRISLREGNMKPYTIRRVPWTCEWGRFGVATEDLGPAHLLERTFG